MIKTLSPHYKTIPWLSPESGTVPDFYTLNIYIWSGLKASVPVSPTYEFKQLNPLQRLGNSEIDVARYINDVLSTSLVQDNTTNILDSNSAVWVKTEVIYTITGVIQPPLFEVTELAVKGYGYGMSGKNPTTPTNNILGTGEQSNAYNKGVFVLPILLEENTTKAIEVYSATVSKPFTTPSTDDSNKMIQTIWVDCSEFDGDWIEVKVDGVIVYTIRLKDEQRHTPTDIFFTDKEGVLFSIPFFKKREESLSVTSESYETSGLQPSEGNHQYKTYNTDGKSKFNMNTGFVSEDNNDTFKQLMLSNDVWEYKNGTYTPLKLGSKNIEYQTRQEQRLLNYNIEFEYAFNEINNA